MLPSAAAVLACVGLCAGMSAAAVRLNGLRTVRFYSSPHTTTVTVELEAAVTPTRGSVGDPPRIFFDLPNTIVLMPGRGTHVIPVGDGVVSQIRVAQYSPTVARVVLELSHDSDVQLNVLSDPARLNFEVTPKLPRAPATAAAGVTEAKAPPAAPAPVEHEARTPSATPTPPPPQKSAEPERLPAGIVLANPPNASHPAQGSVERQATGEAKPAAGKEQRQQSASARRPEPEPPEPKPAAGKPVHEPATESAAAPGGKSAPERPAPPAETKKQLAVREPSQPPAESQAKKPAPAAAESSEAQTKPAAREPAAELSTTAMNRKPTVEPQPESATGEGAKPIAAKSNAGGGRTLTRALGLKLSRVVIDAGHGGHDEGTRGPSGLLEKDLVLDVAQRLGALIEDRLGAEVVYTRTTNVFVPLEERTAIANRAEADLFLSLHANSSPYRSISGSEVYYLSFTTSKEALDVAARENASTGKSIHELQDLLEKIALSEKVTESSEFADRIQRELYGTWNKLSGTTRNRGVKKAPFVVLIGANMPSVLAEIGFISNPRDEGLLKKPEQRQRIAEALFRGVSAYAGTLSRMDSPAEPKQASR